MSINGVSTNYYPTAYTNTQKVKATEKASFADTIAEKAETASVRDYDEVAFENVGPNAPQSVKDAWMEAAKETGANGLGITSNGIIVTEMFVQQFLNWYWGGKEGRAYDVLGSSVESAIQAAQQALYNFDHPLEPNKAMSIEERQYHMKERTFYEAFLDKLRNLSDSAGNDSQNVTYYGITNHANIISQKSAEAGEEAVQEKSFAILDVIGAHASDEVKQAYLEAEKETGGHIAAGGLWISNDGKHAHMAQLGVQFAIKWAKGELDQADFLGNSVESAISAIEKWTYDLDHPLAGQSAGNIEDQRLIEIERKFYESFLDKLMQLTQ